MGYRSFNRRFCITGSSSCIAYRLENDSSEAGSQKSLQQFVRAIGRASYVFRHPRVRLQISSAGSQRRRSGRRPFWASRLRRNSESPMLCGWVGAGRSCGSGCCSYGSGGERRSVDLVILSLQADARPKRIAVPNTTVCCSDFPLWHKRRSFIKGH
jgi:hypothetical protein